MGGGKPGMGYSRAVLAGIVRPLAHGFSTNTNCPRGTFPIGQNVSLLAVQGVDSGLGVRNVQLLNVGNLAQTSNLGVHAIKATTISGRSTTLV